MFATVEAVTSAVPSWPDLRWSPLWLTASPLAACCSSPGLRTGGHVQDPRPRWNLWRRRPAGSRSQALQIPPCASAFESCRAAPDPAQLTEVACPRPPLGVPLSQWLIPRALTWRVLPNVLICTVAALRVDAPW